MEGVARLGFIVYISQIVRNGSRSQGPAWWLGTGLYTKKSGGTKAKELRAPES